MGIYLDLQEDLYGSPLQSDFLRYYSLDLINLEDGVELYGLIGFLPEESMTKNIYRGGDYFGFNEMIQSRIEYLLSSWMYANRDKKSSAKQPEMILPDFVKVEDPDVKHISDLSYSELEELIGQTKEKLSMKGKAIKEDNNDDNGSKKSSPKMKFKAKEDTEFITYRKPKGENIEFTGGEFT